MEGSKIHLWSSRMEHPVNKPKIIGYWFNEKKCQKFGVAELNAECKRRGIELVKIDMSSPMEEQGPFDLLLHKLTALFAQALNHDRKAITAIKMFENYIGRHPETIVMDPLPGVYRLLLRNQTYNLLKQCFKHDDKVFTPTYVELSTTDLQHNRMLIQEANVTFPVVCKPVTAGGGIEAHEMAVVFNESGISECTLPCVAQSFINHGAILYKLFVLGPVWFVIVRPSLKNFYAGVDGCFDINKLAVEQETVHFNSNNVSKADSQSPLTQLDPGDKKEDLPKADPAVFNRIVTNLRDALNMDLLGIDVVIDSCTGKYGIIDVNAFPSYDSVPNLMEHLVDLLVMRMNHSALSNNTSISESKRTSIHITSPDHPQEDSGVDTG
ncbi:inositol-tetrakisphosphate 1-kinase isoform X4 [Cherax quadricarinatus]|uniref:inositol-tetrakisphosphate 1-kinase isoform X4 n=1 Tax=Cherax quadricarinatus TaxID=27406 RepID=UPI0023792CE7|nr:inositol-tetrakisphosphate 1-kinase-like isoform X4 [Cherax quadricarinatus]